MVLPNPDESGTEQTVESVAAADKTGQEFATADESTHVEEMHTSTEKQETLHTSLDQVQNNMVFSFYID